MLLQPFGAVSGAAAMSQLQTSAADANMELLVFLGDGENSAKWYFLPCLPDAADGDSSR
jgi:hypothetical protein